MTCYCFCLFILIQTLTFPYLNGYDLKCPSTSQWDERAGLRCTTYSTSNIYTCLWNNITLKDKEYCGFEEVSKYGNKYILMPNPQQIPCSTSAYQPFKFTTIGNSKCMFTKSTCNEAGQVTADNSSTTSDIRCRCDYRRGYVYVNAPKNKCTCIPSQEDCSCVIRPCTADNEQMKKDYKCYKEDLLPERIPCEDIISSKHINRATQDSTHRPHLSETTREKRITRRESSIPVKIVIAILIAVISMFSFLLVKVQPFAENCTVSSDLNMPIKADGNRHRVLKGDTVTINCNVKSMFASTIATWERHENGNIHDVANDKHFRIFSKGTSHCLTINKFADNMSGVYYCGLAKNTACDISQLMQVFTKLFVDEKYIVTIDLLELPEKRSIVTFIQSEITIECSDTVKNCQDKSRFHCQWIKRNGKLSLF